MTNDIAVPGAALLTPSADPIHALSPMQMAMLGARAREAGFNEADVVALIALVQDAAKSAAETAAQQAALAVTPALLEFVSSVHRGTAQRIAQAIGRLPRGLIGGDHTSCVQAAYGVAAEPASRYVGR